jgi:hypothetical protein
VQELQQNGISAQIYSPQWIGVSLGHQQHYIY